MAKIAIVYASRKGQTARIAERVGATLRGAGHDVALVPCPEPHEAPVAFEGLDAVIVGSSVRMGRPLAEIERFIAANRDALEQRPSAFFSVGLDVTRPPPVGPELARACVDGMIARTRWQPGRIEMFAGAMPYTRYPWLFRWFLKQVARVRGADTDTTRDHEYTDWAQVEAFAHQLGVTVGNVATAA